MGPDYPGFPPNYPFNGPQVPPHYPPPPFPPPQYLPGLSQAQFPPPAHAGATPAAHHVDNRRQPEGDAVPKEEESRSTAPFTIHIQNNSRVVTTGIDFFNYPTGSVRREAISGKEEAGWNVTKWVWRSTGMSAFDGRQAETRSCQGVLRCDECGRLFRPKTQAASREKQSREGCSSGSVISVSFCVTSSARLEHTI